MTVTGSLGGAFLWAFLVTCRADVPLLSAQPLSDSGHCLVWQPVLSPLEGTKMTVNNLHPRVTEEDIVVSTASRRGSGPQTVSVSRDPGTTASSLMPRDSQDSSESAVRAKVYSGIRSKFSKGEGSRCRGRGNPGPSFWIPPRVQSNRMHFISPATNCDA